MNIGSGSHNATHGTVAEPQHAANRLPFLSLDNASAFRFGDDGPDLLFGDRAFAAGRLPK